VDDGGRVVKFVVRGEIKNLCSSKSRCSAIYRYGSVGVLEASSACLRKSDKRKRMSRVVHTVKFFKVPWLVVLQVDKVSTLQEFLP